MWRRYRRMATPGAQPAAQGAPGGPQPWDNGQPAGGAPGVPGAPQPAAQPAQPVKKMTDKAQGLTYEDFWREGWTDELLVQHGYMVYEQPVAPSAPAVPGAPTVPAGPGAPQAAAAGGPRPPWAQ